LKPGVDNSLICHINMAGGFRGGERQTELLIRDLLKRGWRQRLVTRRGSELSHRCADIEPLQRVEVSSNPVAAMLAAGGSDLVHAHEARAIYAGWMRYVISGTPYLLTRRVDNPFKPSWLRRYAYRGADEVVCLSAAILRRVTEQYPSIRARVVSSAHAALAESAHDGQSIRQQYAGKTIVGHIGALVQRHKGQRTIIAAARMLAQSHPEFVFLVVGGGEDEALFREESSGLANIEFTGDVSNVADYLASFDVFVFPSLSEGLGSSLLDALSFGLPVIASNVGGISEIVDDGINGILIPPNDPDSLVNALHRVAGDAQLRNAMRDANLQKTANYGADRMAAAYDEIYRSILERRRRD
jgi:glycosyltransferase involved in cell wall biosynthesis